MPQQPWERVAVAWASGCWNMALILAACAVMPPKQWRPCPPAVFKCWQGSQVLMIAMPPKRDLWRRQFLGGATSWCRPRLVLHCCLLDLSPPATAPLARAACLFFSTELVKLTVAEAEGRTLFVGCQVHELGPTRAAWYGSSLDFIVRVSLQMYVCRQCSEAR